jgi:hypothetical protein
MKYINASFAAMALIVGLILVWQGSSYQAVFNLTDLSLIQARSIDTIGMVQVLLGVGMLAVGLTLATVARRTVVKVALIN